MEICNLFLINPIFHSLWLHFASGNIQIHLLRQTKFQFHGDSDCVIITILNLKIQWNVKSKKGYKAYFYKDSDTF